MSILNVTLSGDPSAALSQAVATSLVELTAEILHKNPAVTAVVIAYVDEQHWFVGGTTLAAQGKRSFALDIKITDGTNTKDEKARYITAVFAQMGGLLGDLHPESYISTSTMFAPTATASAACLRRFATCNLSASRDSVAFLLTSGTSRTRAASIC